MRSRIVIASLLVCLAFALSFSASMAAEKPDFSGTWVLDKSKSQGLPPGLDQTMTVTQTGDKIDVEIKSVFPRGEQTEKRSYTLDGKEAEVTLPGPMPSLTAKGKQTAKWSADGNTFEAMDEGTFDTPYGPTVIKTTRKWRLSNDGKTLNVDLSREGSMSMQSKRVYVKKVG